jgi:RhtB (resistance to homoserine/threonine) family protein
MDIALISTVALISLLAAVSPGPDFAIVVKNCLSGNFRTGFLTSLGIAAALFVHVAYCILGIALVIAESPLLFTGLKYLGALYLLYLGVQLLREKRTDLSQQTHIKNRKHGAFVAGFLCNLLNPKATLFVLSLFTQVINPSMGFLQKIVTVSVFPLIVFTWFVFLSYLLTHHMLQKHFSRFQYVIVKVMGVVLCGLSIYIMITNLW